MAKIIYAGLEYPLSNDADFNKLRDEATLAARNGGGFIEVKTGRVLRSFFISSGTPLVISGGEDSGDERTKLQVW